mgnify:CR=1 FL=1
MRTSATRPADGSRLIEVCGVSEPTMLQTQYVIRLACQESFMMRIGSSVSQGSCQLAKIDRDRLLRFVFVHAALWAAWSLEDRQDQLTR